jgi:HJR/Mrr/RecB family endonuclease
LTQSQPPITRTTHTLPFGKLSPRDFERLCLWLVEREGYQDAEHLGAAGSEQGRDIVVWREGALWAFQCMRVRSFGPKDALTYELYGWIRRLRS